MLPMQPIVERQGVKGFRENAIVATLVREGVIDWDEIASRRFPDEDRRQFAQLVGYDLGGYGQLPYVDDASYETACRMAATGEDTRDAAVRVLEKRLRKMQQAVKAAVDKLSEFA